MGAMRQCSFGVATSARVVLPARKLLGATPTAYVMDSGPMMNFLPGLPTGLIGNMPGPNKISRLMCNWGGAIQVPRQFTVMVS